MKRKALGRFLLTRHPCNFYTAALAGKPNRPRHSFPGLRQIETLTEISRYYAVSWRDDILASSLIFSSERSLNLCRLIGLTLQM